MPDLFLTIRPDVYRCGSMKVSFLFRFRMCSISCLLFIAVWSLPSPNQVKGVFNLKQLLVK